MEIKDVFLGVCNIKHFPNGIRHTLLYIVSGATRIRGIITAFMYYAN